MAEFTVNVNPPNAKSSGKREHAPNQAPGAPASKPFAASRAIDARQVGRDTAAPTSTSRRGRLDLKQFVVFNERFLALIRVGMPIPQSLDLLSGNIRNKTLAAHILAVRDDVTVGVPLLQALARHGPFPPIYVTSFLAGERAGHCTPCSPAT